MRSILSIPVLLASLLSISCATLDAVQKDLD